MFTPIRLPFLCTALAAVLAPLAGCSSQPAPPSLPSFQDVSSAPRPIQQAADAVVRIRTATEEATGSFISATGLLLTNNHVLGTAVCPTEGCYAVLSFAFERGAIAPKPVTVFVTPVAVDAGLDMALVQVHEQPGGAVYPTPSFLNIASHDAASLLKTHVTVVGHPEGHLKKWTAGEVIDSDGEWLWTTAYILPGDSGSPILDDSGALVGIIHRGPTGEDYVSSSGMLTYSIGTASAPLLAGIKAAALPSTMLSVAAPTTEAAVVAANTVYLNAHVPTAPLTAGGTVNVLSALGRACDAGLALRAYASPEDLSAALQPCYDGLGWIECRADAASASSGASCPPSADVALWRQRLTQVNAAWIALNGQPDLGAVSFGVASLAGSSADGITAGAAALQEALNASSRAWDPEVALYLAAFGVASYRGVTTASYVTGYASIPDYVLRASELASAALWLVNDGALTKDQGLAICGQLLGNASVDVGAKLEIEDEEYGWGALQ